MQKNFHVLACTAKSTPTSNPSYPSEGGGGLIKSGGATEKITQLGPEIIINIEL